MTAERIESQLMSVEDYLAWEDGQLERHEYIGGMVYAIAGGTTARAAMAMNVGIAIGSQLRGKRCRPYGSDLKIRIHYPTNDGEVRFRFGIGKGKRIFAKEGEMRRQPGLQQLEQSSGD